MKISHVVHTSNGSHSLYLDNQLRELTGIEPGTQLSLLEAGDGTMMLRYEPRNSHHATDPIMAHNRHIQLGKHSELDALLGVKTADLDLHLAHKGYVVFSSKPQVFSKKGEELLKNLPTMFA